MIDRLTIRMYDMGFGDCFLLSVWTGARPRHVLFDCGSLSRSKPQVAKVAKDVIAACTTAGGKARIELVVCTHRHKDHVCGFDDPNWANVEVGEVWMPWTEDPSDPDATRIRNRQSAFALALCSTLKPGFNSDDLPLAGAGPQTQKAARLALALNSLTNERAMSVIHRGFQGVAPRRFLPLKDKSAEVRYLDGLPGVRFHVLGPSRNEKVIAAMDPPDGAAYFAGSNLAFCAMNETGACEATWRVTADRYRADNPDITFSEADQKDVDRLADEPDGDFAAAIDNAVNNTSLILAVEVGDQLLLFPGDAQWGSWDAILQQPEIRDLLRRVTVLKVSHHGSHNGTPKSLVETILSENVTAFMSTGSVKQWPNIPRGPLITALSAKTKLARSDKTAPAGFKGHDGLYIEWETPVLAI
ncbi:hypothetical protein PMI07_006566 [Rhizobium sp. CF080]|uniref:hypothetical protein n=1 Tax=Rhizobium sp. (strain CF080) TaxID=1144310 RepID=UPI0002717055|nr:hypothetical protein [Rhizobium sp. CF080]EUB98252.1 hypothetical protein PMI07_006566 [Rhizobium sp. CF080]